MAKTATKVIAGVLAAAGVYFIYKYFKPEKKKDKPQDNTQTTTTTTTTPTPTPSKDAFPLQRGSKGKVVKELQTLLLKIDSKSLPKYGADGDFGSETEKAVEKLLGKKFVEKYDIDKLNADYKKRILVFQPEGGGQPPIPFYMGVK
jgi:hypothetical protein